MKKLLLIGLLIVGCIESDTTAPETEDCAGVAGGTAVLDDCGICIGIDSYVAVYEMYWILLMNVVYATVTELLQMRLVYKY